MSGTRPSISVDDLTPEARRALGVKRQRRQTMTKDEVRTAAIRVMAVMADLSPAERRRVLAQASKLNEV